MSSLPKLTKLELVSMVTLHGLVTNPLNKGTALENARKAVVAAKQLLSDTFTGGVIEPEADQLNARQAVDYLAYEYGKDADPASAPRIYTSRFGNFEVVVRVKQRVEPDLIKSESGVFIDGSTGDESEA